METLKQEGKLTVDVDLTGREVSPTSTDYQDATFGWMDDGVAKGYQDAVTSLVCERWTRLMLTLQRYTGRTKSAECLQESVLAVEDLLGVRPRRRVELVQERRDVVARRMKTAARGIGPHAARREAALAADQPSESRGAGSPGRDSELGSRISSPKSSGKETLSLGQGASQAGFGPETGTASLARPAKAATPPNGGSKPNWTNCKNNCSSWMSGSPTWRPTIKTRPTR